MPFFIVYLLRSIQLYSKYSMAKPDLRKLYTEATEHHKKNDFVRAEKLYREILRHAPNMPDIHNSRGAALASMQKHKDALDAFRRAVRLQPDNLNYRSNYANALKDFGMIEDGKQEYLQILQISPDFLNAHIQLGLIYKAEKNWQLAVNHFYKICQLRPDLLDGFVQLGLALLEVGRYDHAIESFQRALELDSSCESALLGLGDAFLWLNQSDKAVSCYEQGAALASTSTIARLKLGKAYQVLGRHESAADLYLEMIRQAPGQLLPYVNLAGAKKFSNKDIELIKQLEIFLEQHNPDKRDQVLIHFSLGKMYDDIGDTERAFHFYQLGNQLKSSEFSGDVQRAHHDEVSSLIEMFDQDFFITYQDVGCESTQPVFVVGMPRSGTTLTEQILASHREVAGVGEVEFWSLAKDAMPIYLDTDLPYPECAKLLTKPTAHGIGERYLQKLRQLSLQPDVPRIVDKLPHNFLNLGLIATIFPKAKIIHIKRDAMDNCLSIFFQYFESGHAYAYDQACLAAHYKEYERIMAHWRKVLPVSMLEIDYEELVSHQEKITRQMIEYIGLPWDERCLQPEKAGNSVKTASIWQAHQPVYKSSVARWKRYEHYLAELKESLNYNEG